MLYRLVAGLLANARNRLYWARYGVPLVYDVGMNNGDDAEYYLEKGFRVVGIEANPELCDACRVRFASAIAAGTLRIINCAVGAVEGDADFYINRRNHVLSTLLQPATERGHDAWGTISIPVKRLSSLIHDNGEPYFVKIDVEHFDAIVLRDLRESKIVPPFISAESHAIDVFRQLVAMGYSQFKLVKGATVHADFQNHRIRTVAGATKEFSFKHHSSGPFGEDIPGPWVGRHELLDQLLAHGLGWIDIHARR